MEASWWCPRPDLGCLQTGERGGRLDVCTQLLTPPSSCRALRCSQLFTFLLLHGCSYSL